VASDEDEFDDEEGIGNRAMPAYGAAGYPRFQAVTTRALRKALEHSEQFTSTTDDLWRTFRDHVLRHEHAVLIDALTDDMRREIRTAIEEEQGDLLRKRAVTELRDKLGAEVNERLRAELEAELRPRITAEIRQRLAAELEPQLRDGMIARLQSQLRGEVKDQLRVQLLEDEVFLESVKKELQRRVLGL